MPSDIEICNMALAEIGQKQMLVGSLDEPSTQAQLCKLHYAQQRDSLLSAFPWPFCEQRKLLALLTTTRTGWLYLYALPGDCLVPRYIYCGIRPGGPLFTTSAVVDALVNQWTQVPLAGVGQEVPFTIELSDDGSSQVLLTDRPGAELVYTAQITNPAALPTYFVEVLAFKLATRLAIALPVKKDLVQHAKDEFKAAWGRATAISFRALKEDMPQDAAHITARG